MISLTFIETGKMTLKLAGRITTHRATRKPIYVVEFSVRLKESVCDIDCHLTQEEFERFCSAHNIEVKDWHYEDQGAPEAESLERPEETEAPALVPVCDSLFDEKE